jgi:alpha-galactosidase
VEFFPQLQRLEEPYTGRAQGLTMRYGRKVYDMDEQLERVRQWELVAQRWTADSGPHRLADLPHGPEDKGIVVAEVIESVIDDRNERFIVNVMNDGLIPNLPAEASVEVPALVNAEGVHPIGIGIIPTGLAAALSQHALVEVLTAEAALSGDREILRQAMMVDPLLTATLEPPAIEALTVEMLEVNRRFLPQFE